MQSKLDAITKELIPRDKILYEVNVLKIYHDYELLVFTLSEQSENETIESIKNMSVGQRLKFQQLITARNKPKDVGQEF